MGNQVSLVPKVSYEDIQIVVHRNMNIQHSTLIINTLPPSLQHCLIKTTIDIRFEERTVNAFVEKNLDIMIIVYGKNSNDITILHKYEQLIKLGFTNVHIYMGGIFEWMLLHEIYGKDLFKITNYEIDILRYRPKSVIMTAMAGAASREYDNHNEIRGYIEDDGNHNNNDDDCRIDIPIEETNNDGLITLGIKWLFGQ